VILILIGILVIVGVAQLVLSFMMLQEIRFAIHLISQQLESLGAPLRLENGVLCAAQKPEGDTISMMREITSAILTISKQLEYLGAPLKYEDGVVFAVRRNTP